METPSMDTIYQAISALYDNPNANEKEKASRWLGDVQKSIHSWKIADQLLQQKKDVQSCYFAAQTMRSKVQHNLSELPSEAVVSLRDSLVAHLERTSPDTSSPILTQLCLALADLALQMPSWQNCISDLIKCFCNKNDFALLEILTVLPQEIDSSSLKLGENRRETIKSELRSHSQAVITFLKDSIVSSQNTHVALKIIKCMTSWIQVRAVNIQEVPNNAVIGFCMQVLRDHNSINTLHDAASDCICALLHCLEDNNNNEDVERLLFESVSGLEESYHMSVAHEEEEKAANYARVFTELAETFLEKIISTAMTGNIHFSIRSLELALVCVGHHDYEVAEITFNLWYRLSEDVYQNDYQPLTDTFKPHIERLIEALARHCQCEPDLPNLPDEDDEFFEFRMKVMGLIKDVVFIVGSSSVFRQMFTALQANISWEQTEAALFVMQSVAKNIVPEEYEYVPKVVEAILSMPDNTHIAVRKTCILLLGQLCEWIEQHPSGLLPSLQFLVRALQRPELAYAAATALQNICSACRRQASAHAPLLLEAHQLCDRLSLPLPHATALARATAATISTLPHHQLQEAMREATALQLRGLEELLQSEQPLRKGTRSDPVVWLDRLAALFRDVTLPTAAAAATTSATAHPCLPAALDAWPKLHQAMNKYISESRVMERLCRAVRFLLRCVGVAAAPLLPDLALVLHHVYSQHPHSCILYVASILVDELASIPECRAQLVALLQALMPRAFQLLQQENGLKDNPDTVDDLFRLCIRFLQRTPLELLAPGVLDGVLRCAALAAKLDHRDANSSVMKFLLDLVRATHHPNETVRALANEAIATYGEEMTCSLVEASVLHLHAYMVSEVAEVLVELAAWQRAHGRDWLRPAVLALPRAGAGHAQPRDAQCSHFHHYAIRTEKCKEMTRLLRDFARLYR